MLPLIIPLAVAATFANIMALVKTLQQQPDKINPIVQMIDHEFNMTDLGERTENEHESEEQDTAEVVMPTKEQYERARSMLQDPDGEFYHFAVAGNSGSGKSSLINALRGLKNYEQNAAKTGVTETTLEVMRHPDQNSLFDRFVWYDIPGAGTLNFPIQEYFNDQGLFIFDFIIVAVNDRFTEIDIKILEQCNRQSIPAFVVRSKADQHIRNMVDDRGEEPKVARKMFITDTRNSIAKDLASKGLDKWLKRVYIVSALVLRKMILAITELELTTDKSTEDLNGQEIFNPSDDIIDEAHLIHDLLQTANEQRFWATGLQ